MAGTPEVIKKRPYDYKADLWSVGTIAIECAQFVPPYSTDHPRHAFAKIVMKDAPALYDPLGIWSPTFHNFAHTIPVKDPDQRPTASECLEHPFLHECVCGLSYPELRLCQIIEIICFRISPYHCFGDP